jgi:hypothetical protein
MSCLKWVTQDNLSPAWLDTRQPWIGMLEFRLHGLINNTTQVRFLLGL